MVERQAGGGGQDCDEKKVSSWRVPLMGDGGAANRRRGGQSCDEKKVDKMNSELLEERKERYVWELAFVVTMLIMSISNYGQESMFSLAFGMDATKIIGLAIMAALSYWVIYRGIGFIRLFRIEVDK